MTEYELFKDITYVADKTKEIIGTSQKILDSIGVIKENMHNHEVVLKHLKAILILLSDIEACALNTHGFATTRESRLKIEQIELNDSNDLAKSMAKVIAQLNRIQDTLAKNIEV